MHRFAVLFMAALLFATVPASAQQSETINISQASENLNYLPFYIALDKGFFAKRGVNVNKITAGSGVNGVTSVISGSSAFSMQDPATAMIAYTKGAKIKTVAALVTRAPVWIIVRDDGPIKSLKDLNGKTIATAIPPAGPTYLLKQLMARHNVKPVLDEVLLNTEFAPLLAGKVDAAVVGEPLMERALGQKTHVLYSFTQAHPKGFGYTGLDVMETTMAQKPAMVKSVVDAIAEAEKLIYTDPAATMDVALREFPSLEPDAVKAAVKRMIDERVYAADPVYPIPVFESSLALQVDIGNIKPGTIAFRDAIDNRFANRK